MRVAFVVVFDPFRDQPEGRFCIGQDGAAGIIALECFDEGFRDAVAFWRTHGGEGELQAQRSGRCRRFPSDVGTAIIREPFDRMRGFRVSEAPLDGFHHQITHHFAGDAGMGDRRMGDDFPIAGIDDEEHAHDIAVAAREFEMIRAPADIRAQGNDHTLMGSRQAQRGMPGQHHRVMPKALRESRHDAEDPVAIDRLEAFLAPVPVQQRFDPAIAIGLDLAPWNALALS